MSTFYRIEELEAMGFKSVGDDVKISRKSSFYNTERIEIGSHVRIDDFCVITACKSGFVKIGNRVHIAAYCFIEAQAGVTFEDFSGLAARCTIYGGTDDYSGEFLTNPCVPDAYRRSTNLPIVIGRHAVVGTGSTLLPGASLGEASAVGSMSMVTRPVPRGSIAAGIPAKVVKERSLKVLELEKLVEA